MRQSVICLQKWYRRTKCARKTRTDFLDLKCKVVRIQRYFRQCREAEKCRGQFLVLKAVAITIQDWFRRTKQTRIQRQYFLALKKSAVNIQRWYRCCKKAKAERARLVQLMRAAIHIQRWFRSYRETRKIRVDYLNFLDVVITIQQWYRSCVETIKLRSRFVALRQAVVRIQKWCRRRLEAKRQRRDRLTLTRAAITIQRWYKRSKEAQKIRVWKLSARKIQDWYRRCKESEQMRLKFVTVKRASIVIQRWFRRSVKTLRSRERLLALQRVVLRIQRWYKQCRMRMKLVEMKKAVVLIQKWYKSARNAKKCRDGFLEMKKSAVLIQKYFRNWVGSKKFRNAFLTLKQSALFIENWYLHSKRGKFERSNFLMLKTAAEVVQRFYRRRKMVRKLHANLLSVKAVVTIQRFVRGFVCRRKFMRVKKAASVIQRKFRICKIAAYIRLLYATVTLQQCIRGYLQTKKLRSRFLKLRYASVVIQKNYRMVRCRKNFRLLKSSVMKMESIYLLRNHERLYENSARVLQTFVLDCLRAEREEVAAIYIQKWYKMCICRASFNALRDSAIVVQKNYRTVKYRKIFQKLVKAALVFQKNYRRKLYRREYLEIKRSAVAIQRLWRSVSVRICFLRVKESVTLLQLAWRGHRQRKKYVETLKTVICIQNWYRNCKESHLIRLKYVEMKSAAEKIQTWVRCRSAVKKYKRIQRTVLGLQRFCRVKKVMLQVYNKIWAIETLQIHWRAVTRGRKERECFLVMKYSAIVLQSWFRMLRDRHNLRLSKLSAVDIQKNWRMVKARKDFLLKKHSVLMLEEWILTCWQTKDIRDSYLRLKNGIVGMQRLWRRYKMGKMLKLQYESAIVIQNWYFRCQLMRYRRAEFLRLKYFTMQMQAIRRGCVARRNLCYMHEAAIVIQSSFRQWREKNIFQLIRGCAIVIQRFWRNYLLTRTLNEEFLLKRAACVALQAFVRGSLTRRRFLYLKYSIVIIQSFARGVLERKRFLELKSAAIVIQRQWKRHLLCAVIFTQYHVIRGAVIVIQSYLRGHIVRKKVKNGRFKRCSNFARLSHYYDELLRFQKWKNYHILRGAAITIQAQIRGWLTRTKVKELQRFRRDHAAITIQAAYRGVLCRRKLEKERCVCWKFVCKDYVNFAQSRRLQMLNAVRVIERYYQCYKVRQVELLPEYQLKMKVKGFSKWSRRLLMQRRWFLMMRTAATIIQNAWRAWVVGREIRQQFETFREVTVWFQALVRGYLTRRVVEKRRDDRKVQQIKRAPVHKLNLFEEKIASRENYLKCFAAAAKLQLSAIRLQRWIRECSLKKLYKCATTIQAAWRGYKLRSAQSDGKISDARSRINEANQSAVFENTLWNRTTDGLDSLFNCRKLSTVWKALSNLNISTRLSPVCCERLANSGGIVIIYQLIEGCNRSVPHMEIIMECISILINLAKHEPSRAQVWQPEGCGITVVKLMRNYFEKNEKIVLKCCSLMWLISHDKSCVKQFSQDETMRKSISNLCAAVSRRFGAKVGPLEASPIRGSVRKKMQRRVIDFTFKPDWVLGQDLEREFTSYVKAFPFVIELMKSWV